MKDELTTNLQQTCNQLATDCISRQAVLDYIDNMPSELTADGRRMIRRIRLTEYIRDSLPSARTARPEQPESAEEYCAECDHIEMCGWYPYEGCEFRSLPSAQPERKRGEWEEIGVIADAYDISGVKTWASEIKCDQCDFTTIAIEGHFSQYNFCPSCGALMDMSDRSASNENSDRHEASKPE